VIATKRQIVTSAGQRADISIVFLRLLEYYSGILFLTTNRIGVIDEAFKSRIHVSLRYPSLDLPSTTSIWKNLLNIISRDNQTQAIKLEFDENDLLDFAETHFREHEADKTTWNGRQIRNAFQTAIALGRTDRIKMLKKKGLTEEEAEKKGKKKGREKYLKIHLTRENFMKIAKTANEFEEYMVNVRGSDIGVAKNEMVRNDEFVPDGVTVGKVYPPLPQSVTYPAQAAASRKPAGSSKLEEPPLQKLNSRAQNSTNGGGNDDDTDNSSTSSDDDSTEIGEAGTATPSPETSTRPLGREEPDIQKDLSTRNTQDEWSSAGDDLITELHYKTKRICRLANNRNSSRVVALHTLFSHRNETSQTSAAINTSWTTMYRKSQNFHLVKQIFNERRSSRACKQYFQHRSVILSANTQ
jgi:hypothetical protein